MHPLDPLRAAAGAWRATYQLRDPEHHLSADSESRAIVTPIIGGRFVRIDYTWSDKGTPQEGSLLAGCDTDGVVTIPWIDSWHNSNRIMVCTGSAEADGALNVLGSYAAPPGPDWGWRTKIVAGADRLHIVMFNVYPDGREELAVSADYARVAG